MDFSTAPGGAGRSPAPAGRRGVAIAVAVIVLIALALIFFNSFYQLQEDEYAVITTFGKPSVVSTPGLKFKLPLIQKKNIVPKATMGLTIGYNQYTNESIPSESVMITVDYNFVNVDFYVEYRVTDPVKYLYHSQDPVGILKMLCQSYIRDTIGLYGVDDVITTGKSEIQAAIKDKILTRLEQEDLGITLVNITIQDAEPPTREVQEAFKAVETAKQDAETATNNANKYANEVLPAAHADADEILQQAEAYHSARINEANGQASRFRQLYEEYAKYPEITRQRLFYEKISEIFPDMEVIILGADGSEVTTVLPLDEFAPAAEGGAAQ
jgi:membrane protease subunit HflK